MIVLVLKPSSLGDIVHALPAVARFRQRRPGWRVRWLVNDEFAALLENNPAVDEVVRFPRRTFRGVAAPGRFARWLTKEWRPRSRPDVALDFQGLFRSAALGRLSGAAVLHGMADAREGASLFYHRTAAVPPGPVHAVRRYLSLVDAATDAGADAPGAVEFPLPPGEPWAGEPLPAGGFIVLHPFARGAGKSLTAGQVRALGAELAPRPVLVVGRGGGPLPELPGNVRDLRERTSLPELLWLLRRAAFVVSVDSGPMHLAAAAMPDAGRLLSLHGWSDPRRVGPFPAAAWVWQAGAGLRRVGELTAAEAACPGPLLPEAADVRAVAGLIAREGGV